MGEGNAKGRTSEEVRNVRAMLKAVVVVALLGTILLASGQDDLAKWRVVPTTGLNVRWKRMGGRLVINFSKLGEERRLLLLETTQPQISKAKSVDIRYCLRLVRDGRLRFAVLAYGDAGGVWFKIVQPVEGVDEEVDWRIPLSGLKPAAFSTLQTDPDIAKIRKLQVGLVLDGICEGVWEIESISLSSKPFKPTKPIVVPISPQAKLSLAHDPAAKVRTEIVKEGPEGKWCWKTEFVIPGGRHMYVLPSLIMPDADLTGYSGLQLTYRANLPSGIKALLIILVEHDGSHYYTDWIATPSGERRTLVIPFSEFRLGGWSQDENGRLDLDQIGSVIVGMHGTASESEGRGSIWVASIAFVL
ncbi:MAG: hypothetical protein LASZOEIN_000601 [Candidatus Fervidibacter sp.]